MARLGAAGRGLAGQYAYWRAVSPVIFPWRGMAGRGEARHGRAIRLPMSGIIGQFSVNFGKNNKTQ